MMELTIDDVKQLALELWLAQRENMALRAELERLTKGGDHAGTGRAEPTV